jgi:hypothetical protein
VTILFGIAQQEASDPDQMEFSKQDHSTARVVWSIVATTELELLAHDAHEVDAISLKVEQPNAVERMKPNGGGTDPRLANIEMNHALLPPPDNKILAYVKAIMTSLLYLQTDVPMEDIAAFVQSIMASDLQPTCPKFWHHAMKDPVQKGNWIKAMCKHLDSCYAVGTFGPPLVPPSNVTVLPAVIILKMIINAVKQINAHTVRICAHGGHQVQGKDFEESFALTVLGRLIKISVAVSCFLGWNIFHFDIQNAFQTCPDNAPDAEELGSA